MTSKERKLAAEMLEDHADVLGNRGCNDWKYPEDWTSDECIDFSRRFHEWNRDPEEFDIEHISLPDFAVAGFLAAELAYDS